MTAPMWLDKLRTLARQWPQRPNSEATASFPSDTDVPSVLGEFSAQDWQGFVHAVIMQTDEFTVILRALDVRTDEAALPVIATAIDQLAATVQEHFRTAVARTICDLITTTSSNRDTLSPTIKHLLVALRLAALSNVVPSPRSLVALLEDVRQDASVRRAVARILSNYTGPYDQAVWSRLLYAEAPFLLPARFAFRARSDPRLAIAEAGDLPRGAHPAELVPALAFAIRRVIASAGPDAAAAFLCLHHSPLLDQVLQRPEFDSLRDRIARQTSPIEGQFPDLVGIPDIDSLPIPDDIIRRISRPLTQDGFASTCERIGLELASRLPGHHLPVRMWSDLLAWASALQEPDRWKGVAPLHVLRAFYFQRLLWSSSHAPLPGAGTSLGTWISPRSDVVTDAVKRAARDAIARLTALNLRALRIVTSQFPEDAVLLAMINAVMKTVHFATADNISLPWGDDLTTLQLQQPLDVAECGLVSSLAEDAELGLPVLLHGGYFSFAHRDWLERKAHGFPPYVSACVSDILTTSSSLWEHQLRPHTRQDQAGLDPTSGEEAQAARVWLTLHGGMRSRHRTEFPRLVACLSECLSALLGTEHHAPDGMRYVDSFDRYLEDFLLGDTFVFMGGSVHARLLMRWWRHSSKFVLLMTPRHFRAAFATTEYPALWPPYNYLRFSGSLGRDDDDKAERRRSAREAMHELYGCAARSVHDSIERLRRGPLEQVFDHPFLRRGMCALLDPARPDARWAFVTHEEDFMSLLRRDSIFDPAAAPSSRTMGA